MTLDQLLAVPWELIGAFHMDALRALFGGRCKRCDARDSGQAYWNGPRKPLEFAHVKPTGLCGQGRGLRTRFRDILRNPDCYELLCAKCHRKMDRERWTRTGAAAAAS